MPLTRTCICGPMPEGSIRITCPTLGTETSRAPSGAHAASRGLGTLAQTDIVQPLGIKAFRGSSNGSAAKSPGTCTVTSASPAALGARLSVLVSGADGVLVEHP